MHHEDSHDHERASGYRRVMNFITDNKLALERGMQKPLRFQRIKARQFVYILLDTQDRQVMRESFVNKDAAIKFADDLDLPCEFIED